MGTRNVPAHVGNRPIVRTPVGLSPSVEVKGDPKPIVRAQVAVTRIDPVIPGAATLIGRVPDGVMRIDPVESVATLSDPGQIAVTRIDLMTTARHPGDPDPGGTASRSTDPRRVVDTFFMDEQQSPSRPRDPEGLARIPVPEPSLPRRC